MIKIIHSLFEVLGLIKKETDVCVCGYKFSKTTRACSSCIDKIILFNPKKRKKYENKFLKNSSRCPLCKIKFKNAGVKHKGSICPKCNKVNFSTSS